MNRKLVTVSLSTVALFGLLLGSAVTAQLVDPRDMPGPLKEVRFDQKLGAELPLDAPFVDEGGRAVKLGDFFDERPVVLTFVYYECPMLCSLTLNGLSKSLEVVDLAVGREIDVVVVSIDPGEGPELAARTKADTLRTFRQGDSAPGWHFLTGTEGDIRRLTETVGFSYVYLPENDEYAHTSGIVIATPEGKISQYFFGIEYPPKDVRLALVESSSGQIGSVVDQLLLYCFRFNPQLGRYTAATLKILRLAGALTAFAMLGYLGMTWRRERIRSRARRPTSGAAQR